MTLTIIKAQRASISVLAHAGFHPAVQKALNAWATSDHPGVLIGGVAMSFYAKPRYTQDVDVLYLTDTDVPAEVSGFRKHRKGAFEHGNTGVEIEVTTPASFSNLPVALARKIIDSSVSVSPTFKVASREGLIAMKLHSSAVAKRRLKDLADVVALLEGSTTVSMAKWNLAEREDTLLRECRELASS